MTRFARARGAAASNERVEEEATPWHQMVSQMPSITTYQSGGNNRDVERAASAQNTPQPYASTPTQT